MKPRNIALASLLVFILAAGPAAAQGTAAVSQSWWPQGRTSLSVSGTTGNVALPASGFTAEICNTGVALATNSTVLTF
jgi:hypothetical protein